MKHITDKQIEQKDYTAITLGKFDGLHRGHQKLIETMKDYSETHGLKSIVFSFYPHPVTVLSNEPKPYTTIYSREEKAWLLVQAGVDSFIEYPFDKSFASLSPEEFVRNILHHQMKCKLLIIGDSYRFGKNQTGNLETLKRLGRELDISVMQIPHVDVNEQKVSSSHIKELILNCEFSKAQRFLSRPYFIRGTIRPGKKIGRTIGFPTVNLNIPEEKLVPGNGVYVTETIYKGVSYQSVSNIGLNPTVTFGDTQKKCETHIFGFEDVIYGQDVMVCFYQFLRGERKFKSVQELREQIDLDVSAAKKYWLEARQGRDF